MSRATFLLILTCLTVGTAYGMECHAQSSSSFLKGIDSCPGLFDSSDETYCCYDESRVYCCNFAEFVAKTGPGIVVLLMVAGLVISLIVFCVSCLCCRCCPWYRRRHQGTVYGKVQAPSVVHVIQTAPIVPQPGQQHAYPPPYPTNSTGLPQPTSQTNNEMYVKQAPYNPNYVQ